MYGRVAIAARAAILHPRVEHSVKRKAVQLRSGSEQVRRSAEVGGPAAPGLITSVPKLLHQRAMRVPVDQDIRIVARDECLRCQAELMAVAHVNTLPEELSIE